MFTEYVERAMHRASYERIEDGTFVGEIEGFRGVLGNGPSIEECRTDLRDALEGWLVLGLWERDGSIPELDGLSLVPQRIMTDEKSESASSSTARKAS
jgi:predicted RNase H-like HicB family nuclease